MANLRSDEVLDLVQQALREIDERPIDVTARRTIRIASLLGDTVLAVYLGLELKPDGGLPTANAENTRRLMTDPSMWGDPSGPAEQAMTMYTESRRMRLGPKKGLIANYGLADVEAMIKTIDTDPAAANAVDAWEVQQFMLEVRERVRHTMFTALCAWERQLVYTDINERIFERFRSKVDATLALGAPSILDQFSAVYRRLREATAEPAKPVAEDLAHAVTTCRRILKAVADHLLPGVAGSTSEGGNPLDDAAYRNRIFEFIKSKAASNSTGGTIKAAVGGLFDRFTAIDRLANKGIHAQLGVAEAELCAIHTYLVAGELLDLGSSVAGEAASVNGS